VSRPSTSNEPRLYHLGAVRFGKKGRPLGIVTEHDLTGVDRFTQVSEVMSRDLLLLDADIDPREAFNRFEDANRKLAGKIEGLVGPPSKAQFPHKQSAGSRALPHFHQRSRSPEGHSFYETDKLKARRKNP